MCFFPEMGLMMNRIRCLFMEGVEGGFQFVGSQSLVVFVQEAIHLVEDVEALQSVDEVVAHQRVVVGLIDAEGVLPVRLYQISVVIILVGEIEINESSVSLTLRADRMEGPKSICWATSSVLVVSMRPGL